MARSEHQKALVALMAAAGRVRRQFGDVVSRHGLGSSQYNILRILRGADGQALPIMTIRERMLDPEPSITRLVDRLEEQGLVARERSSEDRRRVNCRLTAQGKSLVDSLDEPVDRRDQELMAYLTRKELTILRALLDKVGRTEEA